MNIGLVVDGHAEYRSLDLLRAQLERVTGNTFFKTLRADIQPLAPYGTIARSCRPRLLELEGRGADCLVILVDRETRTECPGLHASNLRGVAQTYVKPRVEVVIKDSCFENWLLADLDALIAQKGRYAVPKSARKAVEPNKADKIDGKHLIKRLSKGDYEKISDSVCIMSRVDIERAAKNSRSFRRFLRVVGHPTYASQSASP